VAAVKIYPPKKLILLSNVVILKNGGFYTPY